MLSTFALTLYDSSIAVIAVYLGFGLINGTINLFPALAVLILAPEYFSRFVTAGTFTPL